jgi:hypothetical protein
MACRSDPSGTARAFEPCDKARRIQMLGSAERVPDRHQLVRGEDGSQIEQGLRTTGHWKPAEHDDVFGKQPAYVNP